MVTIGELQAVLLDMMVDFDKLCKKHDIKYTLAAGTLLGAVRHHGFVPWDDDVDIYMLRSEYNKLLGISDEELSALGYHMAREFTEKSPDGYIKIHKVNTTYVENYGYKIKNAEHGVFIDIAPLDNVSDNLFQRKIQWFAYRCLAAQWLGKRGYSTDSMLKKIAIAVAKLVPTNLFRKICSREWDNKSRCVHSFFGSAVTFSRNIFPREIFDNLIDWSFEGKTFPIVEEYDQYLRIQYKDYMKLPPESERKMKVHAVLVDLDRAWTDEEITEFQKQEHNN